MMEQNSQSNMNPMQQTPNMDATQAEVDPRTQKEIDNFTAVIAKFIHGKENRENVIALLKSDDATNSIPTAAVSIVSELDKMMGGNKEVSAEAKFAGLVYAAADLVELSNALGLSNIKNEKEFQPILTNTVQMVVEQGLADGSIDPIELQAMTEELLPPKMKEVGMQMAQKLGMPTTPDEKMAYNRIKDQKVRPLEEENKNLKSQLQALRGAPQQGQQQYGPHAALASMFPQGGKR